MIDETIRQALIIGKLKPWQRVWVVWPEQPWLHKQCETVSFPTPDGTIMVRTVIGDPTTMVEVPVSYVKQVME